MEKRKPGRPPSDNPKNSPIVIRCDERTYERASELARVDDVSLAKIGRKALEQYLDKRGV